MNKIKMILKLNFKKYVIYRGNFIANTIFGVIPLIYQIFLWSAVYKYKDMINGYNFSMMIQYYICVFFLNNITFPREIARSISSDILSGDLNTYLIKPFGYLRMKFIEHISNRIISIFIIFIPMLLSVVIFNKSIEFLNIILFMIFSLNAFIAHFLIYCILGISVFWSEESSNLMDFWGMLGSVLSGACIPYAIMPAKIRDIFLALPFKYLTHYPINTIIEKNIYWMDVLTSWISSVGFSVGLFLILSILWKKGIDKYSAFGM